MQHRWENRPVLFLLMATVVILVGTVVTMVLPFAWVNQPEERVEGVTPYSPLELAGRDVYIREGCNNCHTQTVRPLVSEVERYGPYSKSGEFVYDRPHLWGSRRMGPDLARIGGKYGNEWHARHMEAPTTMVPASNMPSYAFLAGNPVDPEYTRRKMEVLDFPYAPDQIEALGGRTEMDAVVAYLQKLGSDIGWRKAQAAAFEGELVNPYAVDDAAVLRDGQDAYAAHCAACHGDDLGGDIGPELSGGSYADAELFEFIYNGITDGGMPGFASLGTSQVWKLVTFIQSRE